VTAPAVASIEETARVETVKRKEEPSVAATRVLPLRNSAVPLSIVTTVSDTTGGLGESEAAVTRPFHPASSIVPSSLATHKVRVQGLGPEQAARRMTAASGA